MKRCNLIPAVAAMGLLAAGFSGAVLAVEPAAEFLEALRNRGYHDIAIDYLEQAKNSPAVPVAFKKTYSYEKGVTLVAGARLQRDQALREKQLNEAHQALTAYVKEQPDAVKAIGARQQLGNVIVERARMRIEKAKKAADKTALHTEARGLFQEAVKVFDDLEKEVKEKLEAIPKQLDAKKDAAKIETRDQYRADYLQSLLLVALTKEEIADTYPANAPEAKKLLEDASKEFGKIHDLYRTRIAGLYARLYQARTLQKVGKHKEAVSFITNDLLSQPDDPAAFRALKVQSIIVALPSWAAQSMHAEAVSKGMALIDSARGAEEKSDEFQELRYLVAKAGQAYIEDLRKKDPKSKDVRQMLTSGKKLLQYVLKFPNPSQDEARKLLPFFSVTGGDAEAVAERVQPKSFAEAQQLGKEAIDEMQSANQGIKAIETRLASVPAAEKADVQKALDESKKKAPDSKANALYSLTTAQKFITKETPIDDINVIRYLMCYLKFADNNYYDAIILGEFVCRRYPASAGARQCAKIALASYIKLFSENKSEDKEFESDRIVGIADYIVQKWPDQPEAEEALNTLIPFMIREGQLDRAQAYLDKISKESPHRSAAELKTGQALWGSYLNGAKELREWESGNEDTPPPAGVDLAKKKADLEKLKTKATQTLTDGVTRMKQGGEPTAVAVTAALSLAQIYVDTNQAGKAVALLEDKTFGPLALLRAKNELLTKPGLPEEVYKTSLRAYISSLATDGAKSDDAVAKAKEIMSGMKTSMGATADGQKKLIATYVSLARDLQTQMANSPPQVRTSLGKGFEAFLGQVSSEATELNVLNWVGETYRGMGEAILGGKGKSPESDAYFEKAMATFNKILETGAKDPKFLPAGMDTQIRLNMARTYKQQFDYQKAMAEYEKVLTKSNTLLPVQVEVAKTFQEWGGLMVKTSADEAEKNYKKAVFGDIPDPNDKLKRKNIFWGWGQISTLTSGNPKFADTFAESRYNISLVRYKRAQIAKGNEAKTTELKRVKSDVAVLIKLYPDLGGDKWRGMYDKLLKDVQQQLKEPPVGLKEYETTPAATPASNPAGTPPAAAPTGPTT